MDFAGITSFAAIVVICYLIGIATKATNIKNDYIPVIVGFAGAVLGVVGFCFIQDFPATDILNAIAVGIVSGLASTGANQITKIGSGSK